MIKHDIPAVFYIVSHFLLNIRLQDIVGPVEILQVQVAGIAFPDSSWF